MIGDCGLTMQNINGTILPKIGCHHYYKNFPMPQTRKKVARVSLDRAFPNTPFQEVHSNMRKENTVSPATTAANDMRFCEEFIDSRGFPTPVFAITHAQ